jgi:hypothetical protein
MIQRRMPTKKSVKKVHKPVPNVRHRRFWLLGVGVLALSYHSYGILSGVYSDLSVVPYDFAVGVGVLEALLVVVLLPLFLWKTVVWWHERPRNLKHFVDDPGLLD